MATELDREVKEALEAEGYEVEKVNPTTAGPDGVERRGVEFILLGLAVYLLGKVADELTSELIHDALEKAKGIVLRRREEGDRQAQETKTVSIWLPDGSGGWQQVDYERVDD